MALTEVGKLARKFESLTTQLAISNTHLHFYKKLRDAQKGEFESAFYRSKDFWDYTMRGHVQAALFGLCRVYDDHPPKELVRLDAFHLLRFVQNIHNGKLVDEQKLTKQERKLLKTLAPDEQKLLQDDLDFLQKEDEKRGIFPDPKVRKLRKWRHNFIAHQNVGLVLDGRDAFLKEFPVDFDEIQMLIDEAFAILERWKFCYRSDREKYGIKIERLVSGKDDYLFVLESLRLGLAPKTSKEVHLDASGR